MKIIISEDAIRRRVEELGRIITQDYQGKDLTLICLLNGAMPFAADLMRRIDLPLQYDCMAASSYENTQSTGKLQIRSDLKLPIRDRHVLLVDDILDTGLTMKCIQEYILSEGALSAKNCVLLNKNTKAKLCGHPDYVGFNIDDEFVVGCGLDCDEKYRNLPYVAVL